MTTKPRAITLTLKVMSVNPSDSNGTFVQFFADYQDERNKAWAPYTPAANLTMTVRDDVGELFTTGRNFLVTLEAED